MSITLYQYDKMSTENRREALDGTSVILMDSGQHYLLDESSPISKKEAVARINAINKGKMKKT